MLCAAAATASSAGRWVEESNTLAGEGRAAHVGEGGWVEGTRGRRAYALRARGGEGGAVLAVGYRKKGGRKN